MDFIVGLKYLASFKCQHKHSCDDVQRIPLCNSCTASAWANAQLAELNSGADHIMKMARDMLKENDSEVPEPPSLTPLTYVEKMHELLSNPKNRIAQNTTGLGLAMIADAIVENQRGRWVMVCGPHGTRIPADEVE